MSLTNISKTIFDPEEKVWKSKSSFNYKAIYNPDIGLGHLVMEIFKNNPDRITQVFADTGAEMTCYEMRVRTIKIASYLIKSGYKQNDIAGVIAVNSENLAPIIYACLLLGMPINTLAPMLLETDIVRIYAKTKPKIIFCDADIIEKVKNAINTMKLDCEIVTLLKKANKFEFIDKILSKSKIKIDEFVYPDLENVADSIAFILCTSGSTGPPKAVCKTHKQVISHNTNDFIIPSKEQDATLNFSPLFWAGGVIFFVAGSLYGTKRVITSKPFTPKVFVEIIKSCKVKSTFLTSPFFAAFVNDSTMSDNDKVLKGLTMLTTGGAHISSALQESVKKYLPNAIIVVGYGTSEIDFCADTLSMRREGSVGQLSGLSKAVIIDDYGMKLGPNQLGEICILTPVPFAGYFGDPETSEQSLFDRKFFKTGDIGYFDDDCFLYHVERKKEMLRCNNFQVIPSELEDLINSLEGVHSSYVVGVFDEKTLNDILCAFVLRISGQKLREQDIHDHIDSNVIDAKKIRGGIFFVESFPMTQSGKVDKRELKKIAAKMLMSKKF